MALELANVKIPLQSDPSRYAALLHETVPKERLLRWYIVKVEEGMAHIDAVYSTDSTTEAASPSSSSPSSPSSKKQ